MQEKQVTIGDETFKLTDRFSYGQNPTEQKRTYPLPERRLDRFMLKTVIGLPKVLCDEETSGS
jgi:MoxR-like ATPase